MDFVGCFGIIDKYQGWYIVTYALAIYHLNLLLAFLTPKIDPAMMEMEEDEGEFLKSSTKLVF